MATVTRTVIQKYMKKDGSTGEIHSTQEYEPKRPRRTDKKIKEIVDKRNNGTSIKELCQEYKMSSHTLYKYVNAAK